MYGSLVIDGTANVSLSQLLAFTVVSGNVHFLRTSLSAFSCFFLNVVGFFLFYFFLKKSPHQKKKIGFGVKIWGGKLNSLHFDNYRKKSRSQLPGVEGGLKLGFMCLVKCGMHKNLPLPSMANCSHLLAALF